MKKFLALIAFLFISSNAFAEDGYGRLYLNIGCGFDWSTYSQLLIGPEIDGSIGIGDVGFIAAKVNWGIGKQSEELERIFFDLYGGFTFCPMDSDWFRVSFYPALNYQYVAESYSMLYNGGFGIGAGVSLEFLYEGISILNGSYECVYNFANNRIMDRYSIDVTALVLLILAAI